MYGFPDKNQIEKCKNNKNCKSNDLQHNYMDEYTTRTVKQSKLIVPWSIEMYFTMLLNTSSNISFNDLYYKDDKDDESKRIPNPVYTHNMKKIQVKNTKDILFRDDQMNNNEENNKY
jgi:hypothetical protein